MHEDALVRDRTDNRGETASRLRDSVMLINLFTPKAGMEQAFFEAQSGEYRRLLGQIPGWIGNRLGRSVDGKSFVNVAVFASLADYNAWRDSAIFEEHLDIIRPFVEKSEPGMYEMVYSAGVIP